jgi:hypothetical protein
MTKFLDIIPIICRKECHSDSEIKFNVKIKKWFEIGIQMTKKIYHSTYKSQYS